MKVKYHMFFATERVYEIEELPIGKDCLVVVPADDTDRLGRARIALLERQARQAAAKGRDRDREADKATMREINSMIIGIRPTSIPPTPLVGEKAKEPIKKSFRPPPPTKPKKK